MSGLAGKQLNCSNSVSEFIWTVAHRRAVEQLEFAVNSPTNIVLMLGKSGVGKSRLVEEVIDHGLVDHAVAYLADPRRLDEDLVETVREAILGLAESYKHDVIPIFIVDDADQLHHDTLAKLIRMSHPADGGAPVFRLVLMARPGLDESLQEIVPGETGPAFELWPLDDNEAGEFVTKWLCHLGYDDIFDDEDQRKRMLERAGGVPGALIGALQWHLRTKKTARPVESELVQAKPPVSEKPCQRESSNADPKPAESVVSSSKQKSFAKKAMNGSPVAPSEERRNGQATSSSERKSEPIKAKIPPAAEEKKKAKSSTKPVVPDTAPEVMLSKPAPPPQEKTEAPTVSAEEPEGRFWLERAVKMQLIHKRKFVAPRPPPKDFHSPDSTTEETEESRKILTPLRLPTEKPADDLSDSELVRMPSFQVPPPSAPSRKRKVLRGVSLALSGVVLAVAAINYPRLGDLSLPAAFTEVNTVEETLPAPPVLPVVANLPADPPAIFRAAIDLGRTDSSAAATAYAVAAAKGHPRAAYYLGQVYELGEGVDRNPAVAALWYGAASDDIASAEARADAIHASENAGDADLEARVTVTHAHTTSSGQGFFIWDVEKFGPDTNFLLVFADPAGRVLDMVESNVPAAYSDLPPNADRFMVSAIDGSKESASIWQALPVSN